jgi:hypothetical protein
MIFQESPSALPPSQREGPWTPPRALSWHPLAQSRHAGHLRPIYCKQRGRYSLDKQAKTMGSEWGTRGGLAQPPHDYGRTVEPTRMFRWVVAQIDQSGKVKASRAHRSTARGDSPLGENPHRAGHEWPEGAAVLRGGADMPAVSRGRWGPHGGA